MLIHKLDKISSSPTLTFPKNWFYLLQWKPFKNDKRCFLFHLKCSFHSREFQIFVLNFWSSRKNGLIRNIRLSSKLMTSQAGQQTNTIPILLNILWNKGKHTRKCWSNIEYNKRIIFLLNSCRKWGRETSFTPLFAFWKSFIWGKSKWCTA